MTVPGPCDPHTEYKCCGAHRAPGQPGGPFSAPCGVGKTKFSLAVVRGGVPRFQEAKYNPTDTGVFIINKSHMHAFCKGYSLNVKTPKGKE